MANGGNKNDNKSSPDKGQKLSVGEFASRIKKKYPAYEDMEDEDLAKRIIQKYPTYKDQVDFSKKKVPSQPSGNGAKESGQDPLASDSETLSTSKDDAQMQDFTRSAFQSYENIHSNLESLRRRKYLAQKRTGMFLGDPEAAEKELKTINEQIKEAKNNLDKKREAVTQRAKSIADEVIGQENIDSFISETAEGYKKADVYKANEKASEIAQKYGIEPDSKAARIIEEEIKAQASFEIIKPEVNEKYEKMVKDEFGKSLEEIKEEDLSALATEAASEIEGPMQMASNEIYKELKKEAKRKIEEQTQELRTQAQNMKEEFEANKQGLNSRAEQIVEAAKSGQISQEDAKTKLNNIRDKWTDTRDEYTKNINSIDDSLASVQNEINSEVQEEWEDRTKEIEKIANERIRQKVDRVGTEKFRKMKTLYRDAISKTLEEKREEKLAEEEAIDEGPYSSTINFFRSLTEGSGRAIKDISSFTGFEEGRLFGESLENYFDVTKKKELEFSDLLDPDELAKISGQFIASTAPSLTAAGLTTAVTGGLGAPAALSMTAAGLTSWATETMQVAGAEYERAIVDENDFEKAKERATESVKSQMAIAPLYATEGLPFMGKLLRGGIGRRALIGGATEYTTELGQETTQNTFSEAIREDKAFYDGFMDRLSAKKFKQTAIQIAPAAFMGGGSQAVQAGKSDQEKIDDYVKALDIKEKTSEFSESASRDYIKDVVDKEGRNLAITVTEGLYRSGKIDGAKRSELLGAIEDSKEIDSDAEKLKLTPEQRRVYQSLRYKKKSLQEKLAKEGNEEVAKTYENKIAKVDDQLTNLANNKSADIATIRFPDGDEKVFTFDETSDLLQDSKIQQHIEDGDIGITIQTFDDEAASEKLQQYIIDIESGRNPAKSIDLTKEEEESVDEVARDTELQDMSPEERVEAIEQKYGLPRAKAPEVARRAFGDEVEQKTDEDAVQERETEEVPVGEQTEGGEETVQTQEQEEAQEEIINQDRRPQVSESIEEIATEMTPETMTMPQKAMNRAISSVARGISETGDVSASIESGLNSLRQTDEYQQLDETTQQQQEQQFRKLVGEKVRKFKPAEKTEQGREQVKAKARKRKTISELNQFKKSMKDIARGFREGARTERKNIGQRQNELIKLARKTVEGAVSKSDFNTITRAIRDANTNEKLEEAVDKVDSVVRRQEYAKHEQAIDKTLSQKFEKKGTGKVGKKGTIAPEVKRIIKEVGDLQKQFSGMRSEDRVEAIEKEITAIEQKADRESRGLTDEEITKIEAARLARNISEAESEARKEGGQLSQDISDETLSKIQKAREELDNIVEEGKSEHHKNMEEADRKYTERKEAVLSDITEEDAEPSDKKTETHTYTPTGDELELLPSAKGKYFKSKRHWKRFMRSHPEAARTEMERMGRRISYGMKKALGDKVTRFFKSHEILGTLVQVISKGAGDVMGGTTAEALHKPLAKAISNKKAEKQRNAKKQTDKAKEIFGKSWKSDLMNMRAMNRTNIVDVNGTPLRRSQRQLAQMYNMSKTDVGRRGLRASGLNDAMIDQIEQELDPRMKELADWYVDDFYKEYGKRASEAHRDIFHMDLALEENYGGKIYRDLDKTEAQKKQEELNMLGSPQSANSSLIDNGSLAERKESAKDMALDTTIDIMDAADVYSKSMENFINLARPYKNFRKVLNDPEIRSAIRDNNSEHIVDLMDKNLELVGKGPAMTEEVTGFLNSLRSIASTAWLSFNPSLIAKQMISAPLMFTEQEGSISAIPKVLGNMRGLSREIWNNSPGLRERWNSDYNALASSIMEADSKLNRSPTGERWKNVKDKFMFFSMIMGKSGDRGAITMGGMPVYQAAKDKARKNNPNMSEQEVINEAIAKFEDAMNNTQQSSDKIYKDIFANQPVTAQFRQFESAPSAQRRTANDAMRQLSRKFRGKEMKGTVGQNAARLFLAHSFVPTAFTWLAQGLPGVLEDWDDEDTALMLSSAFFGNFKTVFVLGKGLQFLEDSLTGKPWADQSMTQIIPALGVLLDAGKGVRDIFEEIPKDTDNELEEKERTEKIIKSALQAANVTGFPFENTTRLFENMYELSSGKDPYTGEDTEDGWTRTMGEILNYSDWNKERIKKPGEIKWPKTANPLDQLPATKDYFEEDDDMDPNEFVVPD